MTPQLRDFAYGYLAHALVSARDDAEAAAGWSFEPDFEAALWAVARNAGGLVASGALDEEAALVELFAGAHKTGILAALGVSVVSDIIAEGVKSGKRDRCDFWGFLPNV
ncbi:MAG: hypothetical protein KGS44_16255 [Alphaproteobacteria bacterium]|nr:hypothetical protein [Alphaproteobacteria bacterium]